MSSYLQRSSALFKYLPLIWILAGSIGITFASVSALQVGFLMVTIDVVLKIVVNYWYSRRIYHMRGNRYAEKLHPDGFDVSSSLEAPSRSKAICSVVGWREDEALYARCLESVAAGSGCAMTIAGIDGDEREDEGMLNVFSSVHPDGAIIRLSSPLSERLDEYTHSIAKRSTEEDVVMNGMNQAILIADEIIQKELMDTPGGLQNLKALCITQPHRNKKDILFTNMCFAIALSKHVGIDSLFSTDSDSVICNGAIGKMVSVLESDEKIGGVSGHLRFIPRKDTHTPISRVTASHYWFEQEINKIQGAAFGANECQPGPCGAFRLSALKEVLVPWLTQHVWGRRMITNEDRHLTTRLLWAGYSVLYVPDAIIATDTPNTFGTWVKQQVRWSRGTMLETLWYPWMMHRLSPWHIYSILKARVAPLIVFYKLANFALFGKAGLGGPLLPIVLLDLFCANAVQASYIVFFSADATFASDLLWLTPSIIWFMIMQPSIFMWSVITIFDGSWGTLPRGQLAGAPASKGISGQRRDWLLARISDGTAFQCAWLFLVAVAAFRFATPFAFPAAHKTIFFPELQRFNVLPRL